MTTDAGMLGALLIGVAVTSIFLINQIQILTYFGLNQHDHIGKKLSVGFLWAVEALRLCFIAHVAHFYLSSQVVNSEATLIWSLQIQIFMHVLIAIGTKMLYVVRIWKLAQPNRRFLAVLLSLMLVLELAVGTVISYGVFTVVALGDLPDFEYEWAIYYSLSIGSFTDVCITTSMIYVLDSCNARSTWKKYGLAGLGAYALNAGIFSSVFSVATVFAYTNHPWGPTFLGFEIFLPEAYLALAIAMMNARFYVSSHHKPDLPGFTPEAICILPYDGEEQANEWPQYSMSRSSLESLIEVEETVEPSTRGRN